MIPIPPGRRPERISTRTDSHNGAKKDWQGTGGHPRPRWRRAAKEQYKEAAQKLLFGGRSYKDALAGVNAQRASPENAQEEDDTVPLEDENGLSPGWNAVSTPKDFTVRPQTSTAGSEAAELMLRDIFSAVTSCNHSITALSDEIKEVKAEISCTP